MPALLRGDPLGLAPGELWLDVRALQTVRFRPMTWAAGVINPHVQAWAQTLPGSARVT
jgi:hypothetical protein